MCWVLIISLIPLTLSHYIYVYIIVNELKLKQQTLTNTLLWMFCPH